MVGMEDGIFLSHMTISFPYVMTGEKKKREDFVTWELPCNERPYLTCAFLQQRMIRGETQYNRVSGL